MEKVKEDFVLRHIEENKNKVVLFRVTIGGEDYYFTFDDAAVITKYLTREDTFRILPYDCALRCAAHIQQEELLNAIEQFVSKGIKSVIIEATSVFNPKPVRK